MQAGESQTVASSSGCATQGKSASWSADGQDVTAHLPVSATRRPSDDSGLAAVAVPVLADKLAEVVDSGGGANVGVAEGGVAAKCLALDLAKHVRVRAGRGRRGRPRGGGGVAATGGAVGGAQDSGAVEERFWRVQLAAGRHHLVEVLVEGVVGVGVRVGRGGGVQRRMGRVG